MYIDLSQILIRVVDTKFSDIISNGSQIFIV